MAKSHKESGHSEDIVVPPLKKGGNKRTLLVVLAVILGLSILSSAALVVWLRSRATDSSIGTAVSFDKKTGDYTVKKKDGGFVLSSSKNALDSFPESAPQYKDQTVTSSYKTTDKDVTSWSIAATTNDSVSKVSDYFKDEFASWVNKGEFSANGTTTIIYSRDTLSATISISESSVDIGKTSISYLVIEDTTE